MVECVAVGGAGTGVLPIGEESLVASGGDWGSDETAAGAEAEESVAEGWGSGTGLGALGRDGCVVAAVGGGLMCDGSAAAGG